MSFESTNVINIYVTYRDKSVLYFANRPCVSESQYDMFSFNYCEKIITEENIRLVDRNIHALYLSLSIHTYHTRGLNPDPDQHITFFHEIFIMIYILKETYFSHLNDIYRWVNKFSKNKKTLPYIHSLTK